jgi:ferredoxin
VTRRIKRTRRLVQAGFLLLTLVGVYVVRGNAEAWCPFGGVEALYTYWREGNMLCSLGVSNLYILAAVLLITLLFRRAFCGYLCPIGTISDWLGSLGRRLGFRPAKVPPVLDRALALLKYAVLGIVLFITYRAGELLFRGFDPCYALIGRHGEDITIWAYVVSGLIVVGSLLVAMPFCRWLCPLAAVLHPFSRFSLTRIRRDAESCLDCTECSQACPMAIPVHRVKEVTAARCLSCLNCVEACPAEKFGAVAWGPPRALGGSWPQAVLVGVVLLTLTAAVAAANAFPLPSFVKTRGDAPARMAVVTLQVHELTCRGRANLFAYFLDRDDEYAVPGYVKIEAWPGPGAAKAKIIYDPKIAGETKIKQALTEPYFDGTANIWRTPPFTIEGYDSIAP